MCSSAIAIVCLVGIGCSKVQEDANRVLFTLPVNTFSAYHISCHRRTIVVAASTQIHSQEEPLALKTEANLYVVKEGTVTIRHRLGSGGTRFLESGDDGFWGARVDNVGGVKEEISLFTLSGDGNLTQYPPFNLGIQVIALIRRPRGDFIACGRKGIWQYDLGEGGWKELQLDLGDERIRDIVPLDGDSYALMGDSYVLVMNEESEMVAKSRYPGGGLDACDGGYFSTYLDNQTIIMRVSEEGMVATVARLRGVLARDLTRFENELVVFGVNSKKGSREKSYCIIDRNGSILARKALPEGTTAFDADETGFAYATTSGDVCFEEW